MLVGAEACEVPPLASQPVHTHADVLLLPRTRAADPATLDDPAEVTAAGTVLLLPALGAEEAPNLNPNPNPDPDPDPNPNPNPNPDPNP